MNNPVTGTKCDLCGARTNKLVLPASMLDHIEDLEWMCGDCNDKLSAALTKARKYVHKYIADALAESANEIRGKASRPLDDHKTHPIYTKQDKIR